MYCFFFFKQKTAYEMRISDWSSDVCSSDLEVAIGERVERECRGERAHRRRHLLGRHPALGGAGLVILAHRRCAAIERLLLHLDDRHRDRSEEHTSELQSLMRISYAVFCLKKKTRTQIRHNNYQRQCAYTTTHETYN